jgi:hypothetical protein
MGLIGTVTKANQSLVFLEIEGRRREVAACLRATFGLPQRTVTSEGEVIRDFPAPTTTGSVRLTITEDGTFLEFRKGKSH